VYLSTLSPFINMVALIILLVRTHYTTQLLLHLIMNLHTNKLFPLCSCTIMPTQTNNMCEQAMMLEERFEWASKIIGTPSVELSYVWFLLLISNSFFF
jgi:hypothetical protein